MPDYGHPLQLGSFLTPAARNPQDVVDLAVVSEQVGLDLVTLQDHPYQAQFLDTWTLLSYIGARTERVHLAPNVANVPLRPPAVLARSAASLDLLTGGRVELGLGSGAFWDAIEAMGAPRLTPGQGVDALSEAIDVVRGIWAVGERGPLRAGGTYHHVDGAKRGPAPAHEIGLWLGAYKPRMLRLTGRKADGWLPSWSYLQPGDLRRGNATIDEAATEAGRDPREIRRLLNIYGRFGQLRQSDPFQGTPEQWAEKLTELALEDGISTFILGTDDAVSLAIFAQEVAPRVREEVEAARATSGTETGRVRPARALALREPRIDYDAVPASLADQAVEPGDVGYAAVRSTYIRGGRPGLVLRCTSVDDVVAALAYARTQPVPLSVRSGGHGISGRSTNDGGIVIDVSALNQIEVVDEERRRIRVGPGATWGHVNEEIGPRGWSITSGDYGDVGVGGLVTAGGVGLLGRATGLTLDHLVAAEVVLADGRVVRTDAETEPDLFWALRGAGGNFGILVSAELDVSPVGDVVYAIMVYDAQDAAGLLERWGAVVEAAPRELTSFLSLQPARRGQGPIAQAMTVFASDDVDAAVAALTPLLGVAPVLQQQAQVVPYAAVVAPHDSPHEAEGEGFFRDSFVDHLDGPTARAVAGVVGSGTVGMVQVRAVGGAVADVPSDATAYVNREPAFCVGTVGFGLDRAALDDVWDELMLPHQNGLYLSLDSDRRPQRVADAFGPALPRLRELKRRYDPENVFDQNHAIDPA